MRFLVAIVVGKLVAYFSRLFKIGGGSAAPGLFALRIDPELVEGLSRKIPTNVIITGTNGKTTTARMVAHFAKEAGLQVVRNHTGSNLERGIASALITHARTSLLKLNYDLGIWELDEADFNNVAPKIKPDIVVFLNVFRDQLDRYGEVDSVVKNWCVALKSLPTKTVTLVNGDDANTAKLEECFKGKVFTFGVKDYKIIGEVLKHIKEKENLDFEAKNVELKELEGSKFEVYLHNKSHITNLPLPGVYHIYDFLAAFAVGHELGFSTKGMISSLKGFSPAFGRVEKLDFGYIFLIKNPAGATQVFETIAPQLKPEDRLLLVLNDNLADGTDVSWIWDGEFERLLTPSSLRGMHHSGTSRGNLSIIVSGTRAQDLAVRLKYAGFDDENIKVENDFKKAFQEATDDLKGQLYILPTYTAMLELQRILAKMGIKKHYWEES